MTIDHRSGDAPWTPTTENTLTYTQPPAAALNGHTPPPDQALDPIPGEPRTDLGYANRFVKVHGHQARYVKTWEKWLVWDGRRWASDTTGQSIRWMKSIARNVTTDAYNIPDRTERDRHIKDAKRGEAKSAIAGALKLASVDAVVVIDHEQLDADPWLLNCGNGTLNLATDELTPHNPADLITKLTRANHNPQANGPVLDTFLQSIQPEPAMRSYLARLLGHTLVGELIEHILPICYGDGANGKSTLLDAVLHALGDYAGMAAPGLLTAKKFDGHPTDIADLVGLRLARLDETEEGRKLAEALVKRLTGDRRQKARRMREDFWEFDASHTFIMLTNHKPIITGTDDGIWRRIRLVPFDIKIPKAEQDTDLPDKLAAEADAVLAWLTTGCTAWHHNGLAEPATVIEATDTYRAESDALGRFINESCHLAPSHRAQATPLFNAWTTWCEAEGLDPGTKKSFADTLEDRGYDKTKSHGRMVWHGIALTTHSDQTTR